MEELLHDMSLLGMKYELGIPYFDNLPDNFILCQDFRDFFKLKKGKRNPTKENLEPVIGMEFIVYSPTSNKYYYKQIHEASNIRQLLIYFKDKNLYIYTEKIRMKKLQDSFPELLNKEEDSILF